MADRKITDLTALAAGSQATGDLLTIVDVSEAAATDKNKKITVESLFKGIPGDVGIGTSSPATNFQVKTSSNSAANIVSLLSGGGSTSNGNGVAIAFSNETALSRAKCGIGNVRTGTFDRSALVFYTNNDASSGSFDSTDERLRIDSSGNVGIGTSSPGQLLHLQGSSPALQFEPAADSQNSLIIFRNAADSTTKGLIYYNHSNDSLNFTTNGTTIDASINSLGQVGIGTTSPGRKLEVNSSTQDVVINAVSADSGAYISFEDNSTTGDTYVRVGAVGNNLRFDSGNSESARIDSSGRVGIGTTSPAVDLEIGRPKSTNQLRLNPSDGNVDLRVNPAFGGSDLAAVSVVSNHPLAFHTSNTERLRIDSSGNLGVGTSSPAVDMHVLKSGAAEIAVGSTDAGGAALFLDGDSNGDVSGGDYAFLQHDTSGDLNIANLKSGNIIFKGTSSAERARIDSSGNVGVAEASPSTHSAGTGLPTLVLKGNSGSHTDRSGAIAFVSQDGGSTAKTWMYHNTDFYIQSSTGTSIRFFTSNTERLRILSGGGLTFNGDTAQANALDDYEEGTWTPAVTTGTIVPADAYYTKIGNLVHVHAVIRTFSDRSSTGVVTITGLPFSSTKALAAGSVFGRYMDKSTYTIYHNGSGQLQLYAISSANYSFLRHNDLNNSLSEFYFNATYLIN